MITGVFLVLYFGLVCTPGLLADNNHEIKRGDHPYMAFIYFLSPSIVDLTGSRFIRSAILIRPEWLVTSALGPRVIDTPNGFPKQTLMARVGAISIDANITLIEEEFEQEREIVQVVRPFNNSATQWWTTDISLLKTLLPFTLTSTVGVKAINTKRTFDDKTCIILFYSQFGNSTEKLLMEMLVDVMPPSSLNCGTHFSANSMICASESDESKDTVYDPNFCQGNSGGPLICENDIMGLQTYIDNDCKPPHLYQVLSTWDNFITCSIEGKCHEEQCANICDVTYKDPPIITTQSTLATMKQEVGGTTKFSDGEAINPPERRNSDVPEQRVVLSVSQNTVLPEGFVGESVSEPTTVPKQRVVLSVLENTALPEQLVGGSISEHTTEPNQRVVVSTLENTAVPERVFESISVITPVPKQRVVVSVLQNTALPEQLVGESNQEHTTVPKPRVVVSVMETKNEEDTPNWPKDKPTNLYDMESNKVDVQRQEQVVAQLQKNNKKSYHSPGSSPRNRSVLLSLISGVMILLCLN